MKQKLPCWINSGKLGWCKVIFELLPQDFFHILRYNVSTKSDILMWVILGMNSFLFNIIRKHKIKYILVMSFIQQSTTGWGRFHFNPPEYFICYLPYFWLVGIILVKSSKLNKYTTGRKKIQKTKLLSLDWTESVGDWCVGCGYCSRL